MTDSEQSKEEITQVTKVKDPSRVAQGKILAALMKKRKEELLLNKPSERVGRPRQEVKEEVKEPSKSYDVYLYGMGAIVFMLAIGCVVYLTEAEKTDTIIFLTTSRGGMCRPSYQIVAWQSRVKTRRFRDDTSM